ncbi:hypothetical protein D9M71_97740 [compost metagenome]
MAVHQRAVLVTAAFHHQGLGRRHAQPRPTTAETRQRGLGEGFLERSKAAQLIDDRLADLADRLVATGR